MNRDVVVTADGLGVVELARHGWHGVQTPI